MNVVYTLQDAPETLTSSIFLAGPTPPDTPSWRLEAQNPRALKKAQRRDRMLSKAVSRKEKRSKNRKKAKQKLANQRYRTSNVRRDAQHKATTAIVKSASVIGIEDLHIKGMLKNHCIAKALADASLGEFLRQLIYKAEWYGATIVIADRWFPSSKTCSCCGHVEKDLTLGDRIFRCSVCGLEIDRDLNAAINLMNLAVSSTVAPSSGSKACCHSSSGSLDHSSLEKWIKEVKLPFGQEPSREVRACA